MRTRITKSEVAPAPFDTDSAGAFTGLPHVLTVEAVKSGAMPELGSSGMPASLEAHVPAEFRFWKAATIEAARSTRDALVDAGLFVADLVAKVDEEHRLLVKRTFIAPVYEEKSSGVDLADRSSSLMHAASTLMLLADRPVAAFAGVAKDLDELDSTVSWLVELDPALPETEPAIATKSFLSANVRAFELATRPDTVFVTNVASRKNAPHVVERTAKTKKRDVRLLLSKAEIEKSPEEHFVLGIVLEPDVVDSQNDTYDAATIRAAAHGFMQYYRNVGLQHEQYVTGRIEILESYLAPVDMQIGEQAVKAGTWLMGLRFVDSGLWEKVKSGDLTGLSIGGTAIREPEPAVLAPG